MLFRSREPERIPVLAEELRKLTAVVERVAASLERIEKLICSVAAPPP